MCYDWLSSQWLSYWLHRPCYTKVISYHCVSVDEHWIILINHIINAKNDLVTMLFMFMLLSLTNTTGEEGGGLNLWGEPLVLNAQQSSWISEFHHRRCDHAENHSTSFRFQGRSA